MYLHMYRSEYRIEQNVDCVLQLNDPFCKPLPTFTPRFGTGQNDDDQSQLKGPCTEPLPAPRLRPETKQRKPRSWIRRKHVSRYWEQIMTRNAKELDHLPVPPKDFVTRERKAMEARRKKRSDPNRYEVNLSHLLREEGPHELPSERWEECWRWILQPMSERQPEPKPGVPTVTVTDPDGKTWWLKDPNTYITIKQEATISACVIKEHRGRDTKAHCAAFQEAYRKGLHNKPKGMRPEVLYCEDCWTKQTKIEAEEACIVGKEAHIVKELERAIIKDYDAINGCVLDVGGLARS